MALELADDDLLGQRLRQLHEAIVGKLQETFGQDVVKPHAAEVDAETVRRFAMNKIAIWPVIAAADGSKDSNVEELRVDVKWAVFVVCGPMMVDGNTPSARRKVEAVYVADALSNLVMRQAFQTSWGLDWAGRVEAEDLKMRNLGVGMKATKKFIEHEQIGLHVVWGAQEIDLGPVILPGDLQLPLVESILGDIQDQNRGDRSPDDPTEDKPTVPIQETPEHSFSIVKTLGAWLAGVIWRWRSGRRRRGDWAELAAARINEELYVHGH